MDLTNKEIRNLVRGAISEVLLEAQSIISKHQEEFEMISLRLKACIKKVKALEEMHTQGTQDDEGRPIPASKVDFSERFLIFLEQLYDELFGNILEPIDNEELEVMDLEPDLALFYYALKLRMELIKDAEEERDEDEMIPRNKIFFSGEYEALSDLVYNLSEAQMSLEDFLTNVNATSFIGLEEFFKSFREAQGKFFSFYTENRPKFDSILKKKEEGHPVYKNMRSYAQKTEKKSFPRVERHRRYPGGAMSGTKWADETGHRGRS